MLDPRNGFSHRVHTKKKSQMILKEIYSFGKHGAETDHHMLKTMLSKKRLKNRDIL